MDGSMLYDALCKQHPELCKRFAIITGDVFSPEAAAFLRLTGIPHLPKPFEPRQVTELVLLLGTAGSGRASCLNKGSRSHEREVKGET